MELFQDSCTLNLCTERTLVDITYDGYGEVSGQDETTRLIGTAYQDLPVYDDIDEPLLLGKQLLLTGTEFDWDTDLDGDASNDLTGLSAHLDDITVTATQRHEAPVAVAPIAPAPDGIPG